jgi:hypothetical protein
MRTGLARANLEKQSNWPLQKPFRKSHRLGLQSFKHNKEDGKASCKAQIMATRQACQRLALRRITSRMTAAAAPVTVAAARTALASATIWPAPSLRSKDLSRSAGATRWYSGSAENQVPNSRIWGFEEIKTLVENKDPKEKVVIVGMSRALSSTLHIPQLFAQNYTI